MADEKISALAEITTLAGGDFLPVVDTSVTTTKKVDADNMIDHLERYVQMVVKDFTVDNEVADGQFYLHIPPELNGLNLTYVHAEVITAGTTGTQDIQIRNVTDSVDMLSTKLTIDTAETGSDTAATPAVIDAANDDVATNDLLAVDVDVIHTTAAKGLIITLGFSL